MSRFFSGTWVTVAVAVMGAAMAAPDLFAQSRRGGEGNRSSSRQHRLSPQTQQRARSHQRVQQHRAEQRGALQRAQQRVQRFQNQRQQQRVQQQQRTRQQPQAQQRQRGGDVFRQGARPGDQNVSPGFRNQRGPDIVGPQRSDRFGPRDGRRGTGGTDRSPQRNGDDPFRIGPPAPPITAPDEEPRPRRGENDPFRIAPPGPDIVTPEEQRRGEVQRDNDDPFRIGPPGPEIIPPDQEHRFGDRDRHRFRFHHRFDHFDRFDRFNRFDHFNRFHTFRRPYLYHYRYYTPGYRYYNFGLPYYHYYEPYYYNYPYRYRSYGYQPYWRHRSYTPWPGFGNYYNYGGYSDGGYRYNGYDGSNEARLAVPPLTPYNPGATYDGEGMNGTGANLGGGYGAEGGDGEQEVPAESAAPGVAGAGWTMLREGRLEDAAETFATQSQELPRAGLPKIGYALAQAELGADDTAAWAMRRALMFEPAALNAVPVGDELRQRLLPLVERYSQPTADDAVAAEDRFFLAATFAYLAHDYDRAKELVQRSLATGDRDPTTFALQERIDQALAQRDAAGN